LSECDKVVDDLVDLSNIKPTILDASTMMDATSSFDDFDNLKIKKEKKKVIKLLMKLKHHEQWLVCVPP
jgi:hypothetical protein